MKYLGVRETSLMLAVAGYAQSMVSTQAVTPLFTLWICVYEAGK